MIVIKLTRFFYKQHFCKQRQTAIGKKMHKYVCLNEVIRLMAMKIRLKMKNRSHRYDINRHRSRYGHRYTKYKMWFSIMTALCIKQHLSLTTSRMGQFNWA